MNNKTHLQKKFNGQQGWIVVSDNNPHVKGDSCLATIIFWALIVAGIVLCSIQFVQ